MSLAPGAGVQSLAVCCGVYLANVAGSGEEEHQSPATAPTRRTLVITLPSIEAVVIIIIITIINITAYRHLS